MGALPFIIQALETLPSLISAGVQVGGIIQHTADKAKQFEAEKRDPTPAEWDELNAQIEALRSQLHS